VRAHPFFDTVEVRVCDMTTRVDDTLAIAALIQAVMGKLYLLYRRNLAFREYSRELIEENKWRAVRYGLDGQLIDFGKREQLPTRELILELLEFVAEAADLFKSQPELDRIRAILKEGSSADRQLEVYTRTGSFQAVVDHLIHESSLGL
jgi:carboxylate-amine ligase